MSATDQTTEGPAACPSHFRLDRLAADELVGTERTDLLRHLATCEGCLARQDRRDEAEALHTTDRALLRRLSTAPASRSDPLQARPRWSRRIAAAGVAAALGVVAFVVLPLPSNEEQRTTLATRTKGAAQSALYVADEGRVRVVDDSVVLHAGSTLQVTVSSPEPVFAAVVSVDGAERRSVYVPHTDGDAPADMVALPAGRDVPLPQSTVLDEVVGPETVAVFLCRERLADARVLMGIVTEGEAPTGCRVERYNLRKQARP